MAIIRTMLIFSLFTFLTNHASSQTTSSSCKSMTFSNKQTFDNCNNLPTLNAVLHYTYEPMTSTLSMAFTAPPVPSDGWVSWALNPKDTGMAGAQALIAFKPKKSGPVKVYTLDIVSYGKINVGPISYNVTGLSAEESDGKITIFATWDIPSGEKSVNQVWQVGPVVDGKPSKHEFEKENLDSKMKLSLVNGPSDGPSDGPAGAPVGSPGGAPEMSTGGEPEASSPGEEVQGSGPAPAKPSSGAASGVVSLVVLALGGLVVCFL